MSDGSAFIAGLNQASGALNASALEVQIAAYNIANVSTASFKPARVELATGPGGKGVRTDALLRDEAALSWTESGKQELEISGTDLAKEFTHLIEAKNSFLANAKVIGVLDEHAETILNIKA